MIAPRSWSARRAAAAKRLTAAGAAVLPLPAANLVNHLCQLAWSERTLVLGAGDPLFWLAVVVGHEARDEQYELVGIADPAAAAACRRIVRGWRLRGELDLTPSAPAGSYDLVLADRRRAGGNLPPARLKPDGVIVLYGGARAGNRAVIREWTKRGLTATTIPWGEGFTILGPPPRLERPSPPPNPRRPAPGGTRRARGGGR